MTVELEDASGVTDLELEAMVHGEVVERTPTRLTVRVPKTSTPEAAGRLLAALPVVDLTIEDPPIERVIEDVFTRPVDEGEGSAPVHP